MSSEEDEIPDESQKVSDPLEKANNGKLSKPLIDLNSLKKEFFESRKNNIYLFTEEFWTKFDWGNYSMWFGSYTDNDSLGKLDFLRRNRVKGIINQMDNKFSHKYLFGAVKTFQVDDKFLMVIYLIIRGQDLYKEVVGEDVYDSFEWIKLNPLGNLAKSFDFNEKYDHIEYFV